MPILKLHAAAILLSALLLFLVQPMFAKMALPLLGGSPQVWATCMVFFQTALLAGYAYSHWISTRLSFQRQLLVHGIIMLLPFLTLPIAIAPGNIPPATARPDIWLLGLLGASVGLPFFVVSTTGPLLQKWFSRSAHVRAKDPYFLYAVSNTGSIAGLLAYPLLVEPALRLAVQSSLWMAAYVLLVLVTAAAALSVRRSVTDQGEVPDLARQQARPEALSWRRKLRWIALAFVPSSLMLGLTTHLTTDIAAVPLLWVIPLALYLLTFVLVFAQKQRISHGLMVRILPGMVLLLVMLLVTGTTKPPVLIALVNVACFFVAALVCHGEMAADRPEVGHLTSFYLLMAVGGALGGVFNALLSPVIFNSVAEYPIALILACALCPPRKVLVSWFNWKDIALAATPALAVMFLPSLVEALSVAIGMGGSGFNNLRTIMVIALPLVACYLFTLRPIRYALALGGWFLASQVLYEQSRGDLLFAERSFYGVHRVNDQQETAARVLRHGFTAHGMQKHDPGLRRTGTTYYHPTGPAGQVFRQFGRGLKKVGLVGLGTGTLATYAGPDSQYTYYEIDPVVEAIAEDEEMFTFLSDARALGANITTVIGDARLSLAREPDGTMDLLVIDAFSSASIPVHLLTREALVLYLQKLKPNGLLLFHVSNKSLNVRRPLGGLAEDLGVSALHQDNDIENQQQKIEGKFSSQWVVMSRSQARLNRLDHGPRRWRPLPSTGDAVWTDDFSNIVQLMFGD